MKVLFVSNDPNVFDAESAVRKRMRIYAQAIGELHIISAARLGAKEEQEDGLFLHPIFSPRLFRMFAMSRRAKELINARGIEVVSAQDPFEHGRAAMKAVKGTAAALHIQVHTDFLSPQFIKESAKNQIRVRMADSALKEAVGIRVVSERIKKSLIARYGMNIPEPVVIPVGVTSGIPLPAPLPAHEFSFVLMTACRLEPEKRLGDLLHALARFRTRYQNTGVFIFGDGSERVNLERKAAGLGLSKNALFMGPHTDVRRYLESAHVFVQTSAYEGYGLSLLEAALARRPIISTDVGIVGEVFVPDHDVLVCKVGDVECFERQLARVIEDNPLRKILADSAEATAKKHLASLGNLPERIAHDIAEAARKGRMPRT